MTPCPVCATLAPAIATVPGIRRYYACPAGHRFSIGRVNRATYGLSHIAIGASRILPWPTDRDAFRRRVAHAVRMYQSRSGRAFTRFSGPSGILIHRLS